MAVGFVIKIFDIKIEYILNLWTEIVASCYQVNNLFAYKLIITNFNKSNNERRIDPHSTVRELCKTTSVHASFLGMIANAITTKHF